MIPEPAKQEEPKAIDKNLWAEYEMSLLLCPICGEDDPDQFGICRGRKTGRNLYCRSCVLQKVHAHRDRKREMKRRVHRVLAEPKRKPEKICIPAVIQVRRAIEAGRKTREQIKRATKLDWDALGDALLHLTYESNQLRIVRTRSGERYFRLVSQEKAAA